jgi:uncharacterized protein YbaP (TraB family)
MQHFLLLSGEFTSDKKEFAMRRYLMQHGLLLVAFLFVLAGCSSPTLRSAGTQTNVTPAMWQITSDASDVYLFGSFHSLPSGIVWYGGPVADAFEASDELVVESVDSPEEARKALLLLESKALLPDGKTLDEYVDKETYTELMESADKLGLSRWRVSRSQPWFLSIMFAYEGMSKAGIHKEYGVDSLLEQTAARRRMKIIGLETASEALDTLASQPLKIQVRRLQEKLREEQSQVSSLASLFQAWAYGDEKGLARLMRKEMTNEEYQRVLVARNRRWLPRVEKHIVSSGKTMIVVGAAHLVGDQSLVAMLKSRGYEVNRIQ